MNTTAKGFIFSIDLLFAALAIFLMLFLVTASFNAKSNSTLNSIKRFSLHKNAVFLADSLVKNNSENPLLGAALFDAEKHRVKSNELQYAALKSAGPIESDEFFVQGLSIRWEHGKKEKMFFAARNAKNCIVVERAALIENRKVVVELTICER